MTCSVLRRSLALLVLLFGAGILTAGLPQTQTGSYTAQNLGTLLQAAPAAIAEGSRFEVAPYPAFGVDLAEGPGRAEVMIYCNTCHSVRYILMQPPLPAATWDAEVQKMIKVLGAPISEADARKITQYLHEHYTPETRR